MYETVDVVIVGSGAAGLYCALNLPYSFSITIITKKKADLSDSFLAQGGICVLRGEDDFKDFFDDTMRAGHYENNEETVELMIRSSNEIMRDLMKQGVDFAREQKSDTLEFTKEGAHSRPRILFHEDITGKEITSTLLQRVRERKNVTIKEYTTMIDIVEENGSCAGVVAANEAGEKYVIYAPSVVLASGGIGGLYENSTNYPHLTGDALAIAIKHGIELEHIDYVQIHPTTLYSTKKERRFLISESVRGEGAILLDKNGERFTDELQPRDVVTEEIRKQMEKDGTEYVLEDLRPIGEEEIMRHFPNIYNRCLEEGYDVLKEPIPVTPAQHYFMGGIRADLSSRTSMRGLYACGETSCTGVHGRNRLASNSLLEALVFAQKAADDICFGLEERTIHPHEIDLSKYDDLDAIFKEYRKIVLEEMERESKMHG